MLSEQSFLGFHEELEKNAADLTTGLQGLALGAALGAAVSGVGMHALEKLIQKNKQLAVIVGAIMGAGALGSAGFLLGHPRGTGAPSSGPVANSLEGTPISELRVRR